jgi:ABC-type oligopeptide transport system ATPase subunit
MEAWPVKRNSIEELRRQQQRQMEQLPEDVVFEMKRLKTAVANTDDQLLKLGVAYQELTLKHMESESKYDRLAELLKQMGLDAEVLLKTDKEFSQ